MPKSWSFRTVCEIFAPKAVAGRPDPLPPFPARRDAARMGELTKTGVFAHPYCAKRRLRDVEE